MEGQNPKLEPPGAGDILCICSASNKPDAPSCIGCQKPRQREQPSDDPRVEQHVLPEHAPPPESGDILCPCGAFTNTREQICEDCKQLRPLQMRAEERSNKSCLHYR